METKLVIRPYQLDVRSFRNFREISFKLGRKITLISGQNGVGKSNLLSLIASGSGRSQKSVMGSDFQPEFYDFFNIDPGEDFDKYQLFLGYAGVNDDILFTKRLSFKDDSTGKRKIRIIPRTTNYGDQATTLVREAQRVKEEYGVGGSARVPIPTIYVSLSRLYPLGEHRDSISVTPITKRNSLYQKNADDKFREWYNEVIPGVIKTDASLTMIKKNVCSRASLHMDMENIPTLSQSIGQDNIGNIISALVDIYILSLSEGYVGAVLCIDEVDVSLHPDTQMRLLDLLDRLADELSIQFVLSSHSLTILEECLKKEEENDRDYSVVYIKDPRAPRIAERKTFELLKADLFGEFTFQKPKVKLYLEDEEGKELLQLLINAYKKIFKEATRDIESLKLRNAENVRNCSEIKKRLKELGNIDDFEDGISIIVTKLGCEELLRIVDADSYFNRVMFVLDGDARYKQPEQKPKIQDFLEVKYNPGEYGYNVRGHKPNVCFFPDYFAPESYLYAMIYDIYTNAQEHRRFWRTLDANENTANYTADKLSQMFSCLTGDYTNDDIKNIFQKSDKGNVWKFIRESDVIEYYYSDYQKMEELISFIADIKKAYGMTSSLTLSNKYT